MGDRDHGEARYRAFLSYSHRDAAPAARLHRRLEAYRIPRRLVGRVTARGAVPGRLAPIFRDREELPAATDLSETVREALAQSGALIILCSPNAAGSLWVAEEIRVFRELHPARPILAAILDGDPPDCFPPLLRAMGDGHEPLATDLRRERDGERLGLLKLVAGITGLGLDDLVQRDATRRVRRVMAVTAGAVAAMLVMAVLAVVAITAQREAERQRGKAEELVEFMRTDLHDRLESVGRLDIMSAANQQALRYYGPPGDLDQLSDESRLRRARLLQDAGDEYLTRHDYRAAAAAFTEARATTAQQLSQAPDDPRRIFAHAKSDLGLGRVAEAQDQWRQARTSYTACAEATGRLLRMSPNDPDYMMRAGSCAINLGSVSLNGEHDAQAAQRYYLAAEPLLRRASRARPYDLHASLALANAYGWLADSYYAHSEWDSSLDIRTRQVRLVQELHAGHRENTDIRFRLAAAQRGLGYSILSHARQCGDSGQAFRFPARMRARLRAEARAQLFEAYGSIRWLVQLDDHNAEWQRLRSLLSYDLLNLELGYPRGVTIRQLQLEQAALGTGRASSATRRRSLARNRECVPRPRSST